MSLTRERDRILTGNMKRRSIGASRWRNLGFPWLMKFFPICAGSIKPAGIPIADHCVEEFEARLAAHAGGGSVAAVANATVGLTLAPACQRSCAGFLCMVPAWTFAATGHAIELAGLVPWIVDVDAKSWALEPVAARELLRDAPGPVEAVMPVALSVSRSILRAGIRFASETGHRGGDRCGGGVRQHSTSERAGSR